MRSVIKTALFTTFLLFSFMANSSWTIQKGVEGHVLSDGPFEASLAESNVKPEVVKTKDYGDLKVVFYHASTSGTSVMLKEIYGAVFDTKTKKHLGNFPYKYIPLTERGANADLYQPSWKFKDGVLHVIEEDLGIDVKLSSEKQF